MFVVPHYLEASLMSQIRRLGLQVKALAGSSSVNAGVSKPVVLAKTLAKGSLISSVTAAAMLYGSTAFCDGEKDKMNVSLPKQKADGKILY
jgi:hypothetical protein